MQTMKYHVSTAVPRIGLGSFSHLGVVDSDAGRGSIDIRRPQKSE